MRSKRLFLYLCFASITFLCKAIHGWNPVDSIRIHATKTPGFRLGLDGRNSFLSGQPINIRGLRAGLDYGKIGVYTGIYYTSSSFIKNTDTISAGFTYMSSTLEYYIHQSWRFEVVVPMQIGVGWGYFTQVTPKGDIREKTGNFIPVEIGLSATVRFLRYFGFVAGTGYRTSLWNGSEFKGPFYSVGLTMYTGTLYRDFKKKYKKVKESYLF